MSPEVEGSLGLYVHIPFCEAKCTYCHFAIDPRRPDAERQDRYLRAVLAEMAGAEAGEADTLYFGGGTPSLMEAERLEHLVEAARARFRLPKGVEVTHRAVSRLLASGRKEIRGFRKHRPLLEGFIELVDRRRRDAHGNLLGDRETS